jgi:drug/metabolite transporter (DMT)-like permease
VTPRQAALLTLQALCWGLAYIFIASALDAFTPMAIIVIRCVLASVVIVALMRVRGEAVGGVVAEVRRRPRTAAALALCAGLIPFPLITVAQQSVPAGLTGVLMASVPIWSALLATRLDADETIDRRQGAGLLVGLVGVALVVGVEAVTTLEEAVAVAAILLAAGCYALQTFIVKRHYADVPPLTRALLPLGITGIVLLPAGAATIGDTDLAFGPVLSVVLLALVSTAGGLILLFRLVDELGPQRTALTTYLAPGFALVLAALILDEPITVPAVLGLVLIIVGVVVGSRSRARVEATLAP